MVIVDAGGTLSLLFLREAESQRYYPRYGGATPNGFQALLSAGDIPADQLTGAQGLGWSPLLDLTAADDTDNGPYSNAARRTCFALMRAHGQPPTSDTQANLELQYCDAYHLLRAAVTAALPRTGPVPRNYFVAGVDGLGASFLAADTPPVVLSSSQHDAIATAYDFAFQAPCTCFRYVGPARGIA